MTKVLTIGAGGLTETDVTSGGLQYFTESTKTYNSKYYNKLTPNSTQADVDFVVQPKGVGAFIAQLPDGTATGGNVRGANAVDLQTKRDANTRVASGAGAVISGGASNTASGNNALVSGGEYNTASGANASVGGGGYSTASGNNSFAVGGGNTASATYSTVSGGGDASAFLYGASAHGCGTFITKGDAQKLQLIARGTSSSASAFDLKLDGSSQAITLPNYTNWFFILQLSAMKTNSSELNTHGQLRVGMIARRGGAISTQIVTFGALTPDLTIGTFATPAVALTADTTTGSLKITVTPTDAISTRWVAVLDIVQCGNGSSF